MPYVDKDKLRAAQLAYYYRNWEACNARRKEWKKANREKVNAEKRALADLGEQRAKERVAKRDIPILIRQIEQECSRREGRAPTVQRAKKRAEFKQEK